MSFPNTSVTDIIATTIESRRKKIADNVTKHNAGLAQLKKKGNIKPVSGGSVILEELSFAENGNSGWYSGGDLLSVAASDNISAAQFSLKQLATPVVITGLEKLMNSGSEALIDLMDARLNVAEATASNRLAEGIYAAGTEYGGKTLTGLGAAVVALPTSGTYGGIDRALWSFWQNQYTGSLGSVTISNIQGYMNALWAKLIRGKNKPDLILADNNMWSTYMGSLQPLQRFTDQAMADLGFDNVKFMSAPVVLDGGIGGFAPANVMYFLNTDFLFLRPHKDRDMTTLSPTRRSPINQDIEVEIIAWAGNMTSSGSRFQGYFQGS